MIEQKEMGARNVDMADNRPNEDGVTVPIDRYKECCRKRVAQSSGAVE